MTTKAERVKLAGLMDYFVTNEKKIHYPLNDVRTTQVHAMTSAVVRAALNSARGLTIDCSQAVSLLCKLAGLNDPNGLGWVEDGYTGTLLRHLPHYYRAKNADVGGLVVFGPGTGEHVCMVRHPHPTDPVLFSHGQEKGPIYVPLSVEKAAHREPVTFLSIRDL